MSKKKVGAWKYTNKIWLCTCYAFQERGPMRRTWPFRMEQCRICGAKRPAAVLTHELLCELKDVRT